MRITVPEKEALVELARDLKRGAQLCRCDTTELGELEDLFTQCQKDLVTLLPRAVPKP